MYRRTRFSPTRVTYTYDDDGSQTTENRGGVTTGYVYDDENRLTKITHPDATLSTYTYAGDGMRRTVHEPGTSIKTMVWDGSDYLGEV